MIHVLLLLAAAAGVIGVIFAASIELTRKFWNSIGNSAVLFGLLGTGVASMTVCVAFWIAPLFGLIIALALVSGALVICCWRKSWMYWRSVLPLLGVFSGVCLAYIGFLYLWRTSSGPDSLAATRFYASSLPIDNVIPSLFAERLWSGVSSTYLIGDWHASDRPPLQSGYILIFQSVLNLFHLTGGLGTVGLSSRQSAIDFAPSVIAQMSWIPALYSLLQSLKFSKQATMLGIVFTGAVPVTFVNSLYTWPKVLAGAMIVASLAALIICASNRDKAVWMVPLAAALATLGVLSHGGAALALPAIIGFGIFAIWGLQLRMVLRVAAISVGCAAVLYAPWLAYQHWVDPPGDRLLKWHLAGVVPIDSRSFLQTLVEQYRSTPIHTLISNRLVNLENAFNVNILDGINFSNPNWLVARREAEFRETPLALAFGFPLTVFMLACKAVAWLRGKRSDLAGKTRIWAILSMVMCIFIWAIIMFQPGGAIVHQGSQAWMLLLLAVPLGWLATKFPRIAIAIIIVQVLLSICLYATQLGASSLTLQPIAVVGIVIGIGLTGLALRGVDKSTFQPLRN